MTPPTPEFPYDAATISEGSSLRASDHNTDGSQLPHDIVVRVTDAVDMSISKLVTDTERRFGESQNQRDERVERLWSRLDPTGQGELDLKGLQKGFRRIDHRELWSCLSLPLLPGITGQEMRIQD